MCKFLKSNLILLFVKHSNCSGKRWSLVVLTQIIINNFTRLQQKSLWVFQCLRKAIGIIIVSFQRFWILSSSLKLFQGWVSKCWFTRPLPSTRSWGHSLVLMYIFYNTFLHKDHRLIPTNFPPTQALLLKHHWYHLYIFI
jgi:hypothetical protein